MTDTFEMAEEGKEAIACLVQLLLLLQKNYSTAE